MARLGRQRTDLAVYQEGRFLRNQKGPRKNPTEGVARNWTERQADFARALRKMESDELPTDSLRRSYMECAATAHESMVLGLAVRGFYLGRGAQLPRKAWMRTSVLN